MTAERLRSASPTQPQGLTSYVRQWLNDPDGGGVFTEQRDAARKHDPNCASLQHVWLPRRGGFTCLSDTMVCDGCEISFFWDGLFAAFEECPESNHWYCACCLAGTAECPCAQQRAVRSS